MKLLVTGHRGYLGRVLCDILQKRHEIVGWDLGWFDREPGERHDIRQMKSRDLVGIDLLVHLAAVVGEPACSTFRALSRSINVEGTNKIIRACETKSVPMIYASTCSVYGAADQVLFEDARTNPLGPYAQDRKLAEKSTLDSIGTALRFGTLFGWSERMRFDLVVNKWTLEAQQKQAIRIEGGNQWRPFTHVVDAAGAVCAMIDQIEAGRAGDLIGEAFNVCTQNITIMELANILAQETQCKVKIEAGATDQRNYRVSSDKARALLGWDPVLSVREGVREMKEKIVTSIDRTVMSWYSNLEQMKALFPFP